MANLRGLGAVIGKISFVPFEQKSIIFARYLIITDKLLGILGMVGVFVATIDDHWMQSVDLPGTTMNTFEMHQGVKFEICHVHLLCSNTSKIL